MIDLEQLILASARQRHELELQGFCSSSAILTTRPRSASARAAGDGDPAQGRRSSSPITVYINSGGGSVGSGLAMMEMIYQDARASTA